MRAGEGVVDGLTRRFKEPFVRSFNVNDFLGLKKEEFPENITNEKWTESKRLFIGTASKWMLQQFENNPKSLFLGTFHRICPHFFSYF